MGIAAPAVSAAPGCHPGHHVLARRAGVVLWSARVQIAPKLGAQVYVCARSSGRTYVVAAGQPGSLNAGVGDLKVAGHFAAFFLTTGLQKNVNLVVFDLARGRRELTENDGCRGSQGCYFRAFMSQYALARSGFIAEVWTSTMIATNDAKRYYSIDAAATFSTLTVSGGVLYWTSDLGGASSVPLGPDLIPARSPHPLTPCQLVTAADASAVIGPASSSSSPGQCAYYTTPYPLLDSATNQPLPTLTVSLQTGLSPAQVTSSEQALRSAGWGGPVGHKEGFTGLQTGTTFRGGVARTKLDAFENGAELSLDLWTFGTDANERLAWLTDVAFDRLFGVPVHRST